MSADIQHLVGLGGYDQFPLARVLAINRSAAQTKPDLLDPAEKPTPS